MATLTLTRMAEGGIYDQLGGGFCRYSVDPFWMIPHFEKMLYDNGPLLACCAGGGRHRRAAVPARRGRNRDWMLRETARTRRAASTRARRRLRRPRRQVLRLDAATKRALAARSRRIPACSRGASASTARRISKARGTCTCSCPWSRSRGDAGSTRSERRPCSTPRARSCSRRATSASGRASTTRSSPAGTGSRSAGSPRPHARSSAPTSRTPRRAPSTSCASIAGATAACSPCTRTALALPAPTWTTTPTSPGPARAAAGALARAVARLGDRPRRDDARALRGPRRRRVLLHRRRSRAADPPPQDLQRRCHARRQRHRRAGADPARVPARRDRATSTPPSARCARPGCVLEKFPHAHVSLLVALDELTEPPTIVVAARSARGPRHLAHRTRQVLRSAALRGGHSG